MLSIVTVSRNDNHGGNLLYRLQTFMDCLAEYQQMLNWNLELIIVEWNPPESEVGLDSALEIPMELSIRIIIVPKTIHQKFKNWKAVPMFLGIAYNTGIRCAMGDWILTTTQDLIFSEKLARFLANENFCEQTFYRATRHDVSEAQICGKNVKEQADYCAKHVWRVRDFDPHQFLHTHAAGDFIMMHRDVWHTLRGYPEWSVLGTYLDGLVLYSAFASGLRQVALDNSRCIYHIAHDDQGMEGRYKMLPNIDYNTTYKQLCYSIVSSAKPLKVNNENWGLADCETASRPEADWIVDNGKLSRGLPMP